MSKKKDIQPEDKPHYSSLFTTIEALVNNTKKKITQTVNQTITITY